MGKKISHDINLLEKRLRADVIKKHLIQSHLPLEVVCFTCGNSSKYLTEAGVNVHAVVNPDKWYTYAEIQRLYGLFDATSGHLPMPLMMDIAMELRRTLVKLPNVVHLPTGSGETYVTLCMAFPSTKIFPLYDLDDSTRYNSGAPLNSLVNSLNERNK